MPRLVRTHLLRGDDDVEIDREVFARGVEKIIVDVREDAESADRGQPLQRGVGVGEWLPRRKTVGEKIGAFGYQRPADDRGNAHGRVAKDVAIRTIGLRLDAVLGLGIRAQHSVTCQRHAVRRSGGDERIRDAGLPIDERSVAVERDDAVARHGRHYE
jgi:hypothetical protein